MQGADIDGRKGDERMAEGVREARCVPVKYAELPEVTGAYELLDEMDTIQKLIAVHTLRAEEIKQSLAEIQKAAGTPGLRHGSLCFIARTMPGKKSLSRTKLMEIAGVTAKQLMLCMESGKPYDQLTFKNLSREPESDTIT